MNPSVPNRTKPFTWMLGLALVALTAFAFFSIQSQRTRLEQRIKEDVFRDVGVRVDGWESRIRDNLEEWLTTAATSEPATAAVLQEGLRGRHPWVDSLYTWIPPIQLDVEGNRDPAAVLFPRPAPRDDPLTTTHPCIRQTQAIARLTRPRMSRLDVADELVRQCERAPLSVRTYTHGQVADQFEAAGRYLRALDVLDRLRIPNTMSPSDAMDAQVNPYLIIVYKIRRANLLTKLGRTEEAVETLHAVANDIASLDAPAAKGVLQYEWDVMRQLNDIGTTEVTRHAASVLSRANRRALAWDEIQQRIIPQSVVSFRAVAQSDDGRFAYDQYRDEPFLIYYNSVTTADGATPRSGAIVLDQKALLRDFFLSLGGLAEHVRITDADGDYVAGAQFDDVALQQSFPSTLTHLRIEVSEAALQAQVGRFGGSYYTLFAALSVFVVIGFLGLFAQARASRHQRELLLRQREFTTRITHELKTPLAGIRVTAENMELGAFSSQEDLSQMALRIVHEADALTDRVNEILAVSRERSIPNPEVFDVEEVLLESLSAWSPRYDQTGVVLNADLHVTDEVKGDPAAVRDAISCLLDNALKYRDESRDDSSVWLSLTQEGKYILVSVDDNGLGVPAKLRKSIFKQFVRVEGPNRGRAGGHGLGLAQVARVAKAHGGSALCMASEHGGARFVVRLRGHV